MKIFWLNRHCLWQVVLVTAIAAMLGLYLPFNTNVKHFTGITKFYKFHNDVKFATTISPTTLPPKYSLARYELALSRIAINRNIYLAIADFAYADYATNLYLTSFKRLSIENYLFVALDEKCCEVLDARGINCLQHFQNFSIGLTRSQVTTPSFNLKTNTRARIVLDALKLGYNPFLVDLDIVFVLDPGPIVYELGAKHELVIQDDGGGRFNTGFYYARPSRNIIDFFEVAYNISQSPKAKKGELENDQKVMRKIIADKNQKRKVDMHLLDGKKFVTGLDYWETNQISFNDVHPWKKKDKGYPDTVILHNNYIATEEAKVYRFKEALLWTVDKNGYYSDSDRKYLTYTNPILKTEQGLDQERDALVNALSIGYLLNRTVILPAFHCFETRGYFCRSNDQECSLLPLYHVETFDKYFDNAYREHVFLSHDLVPESTRRSQTKPLYFGSEFQDQMQLSLAENTSKIVYVAANKTKGATSAEIQEWFADVKEKVLVFHNLYGVFAGFEMTSATEDIRARLKKALVRCNYRQRWCKHTRWF